MTLDDSNPHHFYYSTRARVFQAIFVSGYMILEQMLIFLIECRRICRMKIGQTAKNVQKHEKQRKKT